MRIAIDGPAASGKTSLGRALAEAFGCRFVETGKMYRAVALARKRGLALSEIAIDFTTDGRLLLNGEDVTDLLHTPDIDQASSRVATDKDVRRWLVALQRELAAQGDVVMEGRDIGTVVLPDADLKLFLLASAQTRAARRVGERQGANYESTLQEIRERDHRDSTRDIAPLNPASDATIIDTDRKPLVEVISEAVHLVKERLKGRWHGG